MDRFYLGF